MPRKQRLQSSRTPIAEGTRTDLEPLDLEPLDQGDSDNPRFDPARARDKSNCYIEPGRRDVNFFTAMYDLGGESG